MLTNLALACSGKSFYTGFKIFVNLPFATTFNLTAGSWLSWLFITLFILPIHYWKWFNISPLTKSRSVLWGPNPYAAPSKISYPIYSRSLLWGSANDDLTSCDRFIYDKHFPTDLQFLNFVGLSINLR